MATIKRTNPPDWYIPPTNQEIKDRWRESGVNGSISPSFIRDIANIAAGGTIVSPTEVRDQLEETITVNGPDSDGDYNVKGVDGFHKSRQEALDNALNKKQKYHQNIQDFVQSLDLDGTRPLDSALEVVASMMQKDGGQPGRGGDGSDDPPLPIFENSNQTPESVAQEIQDDIASFEDMSDEDRDLADPDDNWHDSNEVDQEQDKNANGNLSNRLKGINAVSDENIKSLLEVARHLDKLSKMRVRKTRKVEPDPNGDEVRQRPIEDLSELTKVPSSHLGKLKVAKRYFMYQAATQQLPVRERVTRVEKKQILYILCDASGSMNGSRHNLAAGVVFNRIKAVIDDTAEVWLQLFDEGLQDNLHRATTPDEGRKLQKWFQQRNFHGGGTNITAAVKGAVENIEEELSQRNDLTRPELVVLTDDDSSAGKLSTSDLQGIKLHAFCMETKNDALTKLARRTGGVGIDNFTRHSIKK